MHPSLWVREAPPFEPEVGAVPERADIVVIGGGVAGISAALWLARGGAAPLVLEAGVVAGRASGRNDGQMLLGLGEHYNRIAGQLGRAKARLLWDYIQTNHRATVDEIERSGIGCGLIESGGLRLAETEHEADELAEAAALLREEDIPHELCSVADLPTRLPAGRGFHGALFLPGEAVVQPVLLVRGLARAARSAGARIHEGCAVRSVTGDSGAFTVTLAGERAIRAAVVVHCTSTLARTLDQTGFLARQVFPFRGQIIATDPLPDDLLATLPPYAMSSNFCYEYFRVHGRRFVLGGMRWSVPGEEQGILDDGAVNEAITRNLLGYVGRHFPTLAGLPYPHVWTGIMAGTGDGLPLCGALPGQPGVFALCGFNGYGLSFAFEAGRTLAEQILDGQARHPAAPLFAPRRFA
jgi:gamma-glutamylputrescine oxidase